MNRTPPLPDVVGELSIAAESLAIMGTLARTYNAQRLRLLERAGHVEEPVSESPLRGLPSLEPAVMLDGVPLSASIVDAVILAAQLAQRPFALPFLSPAAEVMAAEAGWWDALLGDVERRTGLPPRVIGVDLPPEAPPSVRAILAERVSP